MPYPRELNLDLETETRLKSYLDEELFNHYAERSSWIDDLKRWQTDYFAKPTSEKKTFPFVGAANLVIPLIAITVEAVHARAMTTIFALDDIVSLKVAKIFSDVDYPLTQYANAELKHGVNFYKFSDTTLLENHKFGTCVGKTGWEELERKAVKEIDGEEVEFTVVTSRGATADSVPLARFLMPFSAQDPQKAPWVGEEHEETAYYVKTLVDSGFFKKDTWETLKSWVLQSNNSTQSSATYNQQINDLQNQTPVWPKTLEWCELWLAFDVDGDGKDEEIIVHYHRLSRTILSVRYNWYDDLHRPYRLCNYFPLEHRWAGIGIAKQNDQFQREITVQHRQRIDNATLANMRMYKVNKLSGYGPGEPVFPGKLWMVENKDDIESIQMGEIYPSAYNNEDKALLYAQQRSGINDLTLGMPQVGTPGTASDATLRFQESGRKFDYTFKNEKQFLKEIALDVMCNVAQFGHRDVQVFNFIQGGDLVQQFFQLPISLLRNPLVFDINIVGANQSNLIDRASWTQMAGIMQNYYTAMFQLAQQIGNPQLIQQIAMKAMTGGTEAMKQILQSYDVRDADRLILDLNGLTQPPQPGANQGPQIPQPTPGMGGNSAINPGIAG